MRFTLFGRLFSTKLETGITGLKADPNARQKLQKLYESLKTDAITSLPEGYEYRRGLLATVESRMKLLGEAGRSDVEIEREIGEGQLEELVEQAEAEHQLLQKVKQWKPW